MARSGRQPVKGAEELGEFVAGTIPGGGGREGVGKRFQGGGTGGVAVRDGHHATAQCAKGAEIKRCRMAEVELREITERAFEAYGKPLENVSAFKYLGR